MSNTINTAFNTLMSKIKTNFSYLKTKVDGLLSSLNSHSSNTVSHITAAERSSWNNKQSVISDLEIIRSGASAGAAALQSGDNISELINDSGYLTSHQDISGKVDKVSGKGLSENDFTNALKTKLEGLENAPSVTIVQQSNPDTGMAATYQLKVGNTLTGAKINIAKDKFIGTPVIKTCVTANTPLNGLAVGDKYVEFPISNSTDKQYLSVSELYNVYQQGNGITFDGNQIKIDTTVVATKSDLPTNLSDLTDDLGTSPTHTHSQYLTAHQDISGKANSADLAAVATSGSYNDLTNKPVIPDAQIQADWNQTTTTAKDYIKNKPTIPTVPTNVSSFTNDAGYTANAGTITGITMNGVSKGTSGVVDLGTVATSDTKNTAGSTNKLYTQLYLIGAATQGDNPQTYSYSNVFITNTGKLNVPNPGESSNSTIAATTAWVNAKGYTTNVGTVTSVNNTSPDSSGNVSLTIPAQTDVKINNTSVTSSGVANIVTNTAYNASSNKIATMSDLPTVPTNISSFTNDSGYITSSSIPTIATSVSSASTNSETVGAKLFYDSVGNIETLLQGV